MNKGALDAGGGASGQVQELERRGQGRLPAEAGRVLTPLRADAWQQMLADHPDRPLVDWMIRGIKQGFRVGYQADPTELRQAKQNLSSAREHPEEVTKYIESERSSGQSGAG